MQGRINNSVFCIKNQIISPVPSAGGGLRACAGKKHIAASGVGLDTKRILGRVWSKIVKITAFNRADQYRNICDLGLNLSRLLLSCAALVVIGRNHNRGCFIVFPDCLCNRKQIVGIHRHNDSVSCRLMNCAARSIALTYHNQVIIAANGKKTPFLFAAERKSF